MDSPGTHFGRDSSTDIETTKLRFHPRAPAEETRPHTAAGPTVMNIVHSAFSRAYLTARPLFINDLFDPFAEDLMLASVFVEENRDKLY